MSDVQAFDYEAALWGAETVRPGEWTIAGYRLDEALVHLPQGGRILELGCGAGRFLRAIHRHRPEFELVGADVSRNALAILSENSPEIETRLVESRSLPADDGEFDAVLAIDVLEHVTDPNHTLAEIHRVLAPGGIFHLHVPCEADPRSLWRWLPGQAGERGLKRRLGGHIQSFRRDEILRRLQSSGFEIVRVRNSLHLLGNLADVTLFIGLEFANRRRPTGMPTTTGVVIARKSRALRGVDAVLCWEARLLGRVPSWSIHVSARTLGASGC
jgi:ubiquinone/menaquinone biosynthesis C-methylase UbiE